jgi:hypothetical protein
MKTKKKTNIRTIIRKIVREEVAMAIGEVITELKQPTQQVSQPQPNKKIVEKKQYTNNSILNDVLNETASDDSEWQTMGGGTYDSSKMNNVMSSQYGDMMNNTPNQSADLTTEMGVNPNDPSMNFLKKDYRKVMKAIDKKKGK